MELIETQTVRGFDLIKFSDYYNSSCSIQKSSLALTNAIWIGVNNVSPKVMAVDAEKLGVETSETTGWVQYPIPDEVLLTSRMHLTREQVELLIPILQKFVDTGEIA